MRISSSDIPVQWLLLPLQPCLHGAFSPPLFHPLFQAIFPPTLCWVGRHGHCIWHSSILPFICSRRKAELTIAQIREKLPNGWADWNQIWHACANSYGNGYTPNKLRLDTQGGHLGVLGGKQFKSLGGCPIGTNFGSRLRFNLGMDIGWIQVAPQYPSWYFEGG